MDISAYLSYLHDISRKILQRGGFENALYGKSKRQNPCYLDASDDSLSEYAVQISKMLRQQPGRGLFLGIGLVTGQGNGREGGRARRLCAPLLLAPVVLASEDDETEEEVEGRDTISVDWDALTLNYDLVTSLLDNFKVEDEENVGFGFEEPNHIDTARLAALSAAELAIDRLVATESGRRRLLEGGAVVEILEELRKGIPEFKRITTATQVFSLDDLDKFVTVRDLQFFPHSYYFVSQVPDQLSTAVALRKLKRSCEHTGFENPLLGRLFSNALENKQSPLTIGLMPIQKIEAALELVPMRLSAPQREAVIKAWSNEFTYIQGPPGTGKSHTITALMLTAMFLGMRVLMVCHKKAAVDVVHHKLEGILGSDRVIHVSDSPEERKKLRASLRHLCQDADKLETVGHLESLERQRSVLEREIRSLCTEVASITAAIKSDLEKQQDYVMQNAEFVENRRKFAEVFRVSNEASIGFRADRFGQNFFDGFKLFENIIAMPTAEREGVPRAKLLQARRFLTAVAKQTPAEKSRLALDTVTVEYLRDYEKLSRQSVRTRTAERLACASGLAVLRGKLQNKQRELEDKRAKLAKVWTSASLYKSLRQSQGEVETFERMLHWRNPSRVEEMMEKIETMGEGGFNAITKTFPLWLGEMRHLGGFLPFSSRLFDLVIVDEASQVNIAEIIPAFYRGARVCVVGDHKQLGLNAAGLFTLSHTYEQLAWNLNLKGEKVPFQAAKDKSLLVSKSSILEFTQEALKLRPVTLNEHFRSHPRLAGFTSDAFYKEDGGGLRIMTEVFGNIRRPCFRSIRVGGERSPGEKIVPAEVDEVVRRLKELINSQSYLLDDDLKPHGYSAAKPPSIGVISFVTQQRDFLRGRVEDEFDTAQIEKFRLYVGTPEDFQGNERNIMFITFGLDSSLRYAKAFYEEPKRFNVATSRAVDFTYVVYGGIPDSADLLARYIRHFDPSFRSDQQLPPVEGVQSAPSQEHWHWTYDRSRCESEFERRVAEFLENFSRVHKVKLFNQVTCCGQKRLDFVLFHGRTEACVAVEVDGQDHYAVNGKSYSEAHLERVDILRRAGWKILHIPYYAWYKNGWICERDEPHFRQTIDRLTAELRVLLGIG